MAVITGEAGIGKSRPRHAAIDTARDRGIHTLAARCIPAGCEIRPAAAARDLFINSLDIAARENADSL